MRRWDHLSDRVQRSAPGPHQRITLTALGRSALPTITWDASAGYQPAGCSADARFVYLARIGSADGGAVRAAVDRVDLTTGLRQTVLESGTLLPDTWTR